MEIFPRMDGTFRWIQRRNPPIQDNHSAHIPNTTFSGPLQPAGTVYALSILPTSQLYTPIKDTSAWTAGPCRILMIDAAKLSWLRLIAVLGQNSL